MAHMDSPGFATVDPSSVYGAALALPQLARSMACSGSLTLPGVSGWFSRISERGVLPQISQSLL